ncbi:MAG TPA: hypothetical protein VFP59_18495 [Candidatus Angelobacter sp.]|nr:hypothetical protein [Candidatus Angelobacter sp.]
MQKLIARTLAVALMMAVFSLPMGLSAATDGDDQPHMQAALQALRQAEQQLQAAAHDKQGHRAQALKLTQDAIRQVEMGIKAGARDAERHEHRRR